MAVSFISPSQLVNDPAASGALDEAGKLRVMPASFYDNFSTAELTAFCVRNGLYSLPTEELVSWLRMATAQQDTLEIGAGNGVLAKALGIRATDNCMQTWPSVAAHYAALRQPTVQYGENVEALDASAAIAKYRPSVVLACWVTHLYRPEEHEREGNMFGVDEAALLAACSTYIHVGNSKTHAKKPIRAMPHRVYRFPWLKARSVTPELNEISVWGARLPGEPPEP